MRYGAKTVSIELWVTVVYGTCCVAVVLKSTMDTDDPVPDRASRKARAASRTFWALLPIEPDSSSTSITSMPHTGSRFGFGPGVVTRTACGRTSSSLVVDAVQPSVVEAANPAS